MSVVRDQPYLHCHFELDLNGSPLHFHEVIGLQTTVDVIPWRDGSSRQPEPVLVPGLLRHGPVTLRRGFDGRQDLAQWLRDVQSQGPAAKATVVLTLLNERREPVAQWKLRNAWPQRLSWGPFDGNGHHLLVEELVLAVEQITLE